jgi:hypothetical protein
MQCTAECQATFPMSINRNARQMSEHSLEIYQALQTNTACTMDRGFAALAAVYHLIDSLPCRCEYSFALGNRRC